MIFAHEITYHELAAAKVAVVTLSGEMIGGPDRKSESESWKWKEWQMAIKDAFKDPKAVPPRVMDYYQATKHLSRPPQHGDKAIDQKGWLIDEPAMRDGILHALGAKGVNIHVESKRVGAMPSLVTSDELNTLLNNGGHIKPFKSPRFTWSYTSLQEFLTCPAQWAAKRYYKTLVEKESEAMRVGNMIHATAEHYLKSKIGQTFKQSQIHSAYLPMVQRYCDALLASGAELHVEKEMCFDKAFKPCGWKDWDTVYVRSKGDVLAKKGNKISILDWKSGKYKEDFLQLEMFAVFAALTPEFKDVQEFDPKFIFIKEAAPKNILRLPQPIQRSELKGILGKIIAIVRRMEAAWESETFPCRKNGLCRNYCANTDCTHCGG